MATLCGTRCDFGGCPGQGWSWNRLTHARPFPRGLVSGSTAPSPARVALLAAAQARCQPRPEVQRRRRRAVSGGAGAGPGPVLRARGSRGAAPAPCFCPASDERPSLAGRPGGSHGARGRRSAPCPWPWPCRGQAPGRALPPGVTSPELLSPSTAGPERVSERTAGSVGPSAGVQPHSVMVRGF